MNISEIMTPNPLSVQPSDTLLHASKLLKENNINHLPVVNGDGFLVGIVSDRDLKKASASEATTLEVHELLYLLDKILIERIMTSRPVSIDAGESLQAAAKMLTDNKIGCLPILQNGRLAGIVTKGDMVRQMAKDAF